MIEVDEAVTIHAPPDKVWKQLADFGGIARWAPNVDHSCLMSEQVDGVGAVRRIQAGRNTVVERVEIWQPGERLAYRIEGLPPVVHSVTNTWQIDSSNAAGTPTRVTLASSIEPGPRPPHQLAARAVARVLAKTSGEMLQGLKQQVEGADS